MSQFIFVKIPEQIMPDTRAEKYEDPLNEYLEKEGLGEVSGGGTMESAPDKDGNCTIEYVGVDVDLSDFERGLPLLKAELCRLGVPSGTELLFTRDNVHFTESVS